MHFNAQLALFLCLLQPQDERLADRIVAVVNDEPILLSELYQAPVENVEQGDDVNDVLQNRLESRINQVLILQEVRRLKFFSVTPEQIRQYREQLMQRYGGSAEAMDEGLRQAGVRPEELDSIIQRILFVNAFIDYRFRRSLNIEDEEVEEYYETTFTESFNARNPGAPLPKLETVRNLIRRLIEEQRVNDKLEQWLDDARSRARIIIKF